MSKERLIFFGFLVESQNVVEWSGENFICNIKMGLCHSMCTIMDDGYEPIMTHEDSLINVTTIFNNDFELIELQDVYTETSPPRTTLRCRPHLSVPSHARPPPEI